MSTVTIQDSTHAATGAHRSGSHRPHRRCRGPVEAGPIYQVAGLTKHTTPATHNLI